MRESEIAADSECEGEPMDGDTDAERLGEADGDPVLLDETDVEGDTV